VVRVNGKVTLGMNYLLEGTVTVGPQVGALPIRGLFIAD